MEFRRNRSPGGKQVSTDRGERYAAWLRRRPDRRFAFGVAFRAVTFADHRSGWSAVWAEFSLGWWLFRVVLLRWPNKPYKEYRTISLAEQIRRDHGPSLEETERKEAEREAEEKEAEKARLALFDKMLKEHEARRQ